RLWFVSAKHSEIDAFEYSKIPFHYGICGNFCEQQALHLLLHFRGSHIPFAVSWSLVAPCTICFPGSAFSIQNAQPQPQWMTDALLGPRQVEERETGTPINPK
ncbi:MAG: hypothetical protein ACKPKO_24705, partial [Candidatus Fonsibacter sp.]